MGRFWKNTKGAVTVFVTLLLIPSMLVSGTAVDLSRIHTARSIVQDANQLAANAVLTQYDAMLQDIYGLYAVMESDPVLGSMLNEYIEVAILGEGWQDRQLGTFQLFYGSGKPETTATPAPGKHLRNQDVLRRQIEEYAKYRAPVIIIKEVLERIEKFKTVKADSEAIEKKMKIDDKIGEIDEIYKEIYDLITEINKYRDAEQSAFESINTYLNQINYHLKELNTTREDYTDEVSLKNNFPETENEDKIDDLEKKYKAIKENIRSVVKGGNVGIGWMNGSWSSTNRSNGIRQALGDRKSALNSYIPLLSKLVEKCEKADLKKAELSQMVDELEQKLNDGSCSSELIGGMREPQRIVDEHGNLAGFGLSVIEEYRALLSYSLKAMAEAVKNKNEPEINNTIGILNDVGYGSVFDNRLTMGGTIISLDNLESLPDHIFDIDNIVRRMMGNPDDIETLGNLASLTNYHYTAPDKFKLFQDEEFNSTHNKDFYKQLYERYDSVTYGHERKKKEEKENANKLFDSAQELFKTVTLTPDGAKYYKVEEGGDSSGFGNEGDWGVDKEASKQTQNALKNNIIGQFKDLFDSAGNRILLLTYDTEMFSNFTTEKDTKTMSGVPMNTDVNYFFQSELEYLYNGNEKSAKSNIAAVSGLIFLMRFVFNYVSTFVISEIKYELTLIAAPAGPASLIVRELARLGYALAESALDMKELMARPGKSVPLFKTKIGQWRFSLHSAAIEGMSIPATISEYALGEREDKGDGIFYVDYLRIFLLFRDIDTLAVRTTDLITWNMTNKKNGIGADEGKMATATLYDMSKGFTDFTISTTVNLRMLFLSMPFAQKGINGRIPPKTMPVIVTDYRGY